MYDASLAIGVFMLALMFAIALLVIVIMIAFARWRLFKKAGEKGWKAIIPIYSDYILYKLTWDTKFFWINLIVTSSLSLIIRSNTTPSGTMNSTAAYFSTLAGIFGIVWNAIYCIKIARAYGKDSGFAIGLYFLNPIFMLILAFGSAKYVGNSCCEATPVAKSTKTTKSAKTTKPKSTKTPAKKK